MEAKAGILVATFLLAATLANPVSKPNEVGVVNSFHADDATQKGGENDKLKLIRDDWRLPIHRVPSNYKIKLTLTDKLKDAKKFDGTVAITFKVEPVEGADNKTIILNALDMAIKSAALKDLQSANPEISIPLDKVSMNTTLQRLTLKLENDLKPKSDYRLTISYEGHLQNDMYGWYLSNYSENGINEWIATTQFQPTHARKAFPCFDEPHFKATFDIQITHPKEYSAISNGEVTRIDEEGNLVTTKFDTTPKMSTYIVAFVVSKFSWLGWNHHGFLHRIWAQNDLVTTGQYALSVSPATLEAMYNFTDVDYTISTLKKLDQVAIPDFSAGAMENWGLVTYRESALLWDEQESTTASKQRIASVIGHELAHMWFGNLLTCQWWNVTWLNEGFARYYQYYATDKVETDWELDKQFVVEQQQTIMNSDALESAQPLSSPEEDVLTPDQIKGKFSSFSYNKGASVIRMLQHFLGEGKFYEGIRTYMHPENHFTSVQPDVLWSNWDNVKLETLPKNKKVKDVMPGWTQNPGYPVVSVTYNNTTKEVELKAQRFFSHNTTEAKDSVWYIPITYTTSSKPLFHVTAPISENWLVPNKILKLKEDLNKDDSWILLNIQSSAYYRVNYNDVLWGKLQNALLKNHSQFHVLNRAQIADDSLNLARAGFMLYSKALDVLQYLSNEIDYYPWYSAFNGFAFLKRRIDSDDEVAKYLNVYIGDLMAKLYKNVNTSGSTRHVDILKRNLAYKWACELNQTDCKENSVKQFNDLKTRGVAVDPDFRSVVYCTGIRHGQKGDWNYLYARFLNTKVASEITTIISALGCTADKKLLQAYLEKSIDPKSGIRKQDAQSVFTAVITGTPQGVDVGLEFLIKDYDKMQTYYGSWNALATVITSIGDRLTTKDQIKKLEDLIGKIESEEVKNAGKEAVASSRENIAWAEDKKQDLLNYLKGSAASLKISFATTVMAALVLVYQW